MKTTEHCTDCRNNFYNGNNSLGVSRCWSLESAKMVTKFRLSSSCPMWIREAYVKVKVPSCYHETGYAFLAAIPDYAKTKAQRDAITAREKLAELAPVAMVTAQPGLSKDNPDDCIF